MPLRNGILVVILGHVGSIHTRHRIVERNRPVFVLAVYTGDPSHKACLSTALIISSTAFTRFLSPLLRLHLRFLQQTLSQNGKRPLTIFVVTVLEPKKFATYLFSFSFLIPYIDSSWRPHGHFSRPFPLGLYYRSYSRWKLSRSPRTTLHQH